MLSKKTDLILIQDFKVGLSLLLVFSFMYCLVLIFVLSPFLYLYLYVLGDDALIQLGVFHANQTSMCLDQHLN